MIHSWGNGNHLNFKKCSANGFKNRHYIKFCTLDNIIAFVCVSMHMEVRRPPWCHPQGHCLLFWEAGETKSPISLELTNKAGLASQQTPGTILSLPPQHHRTQSMGTGIEGKILSLQGKHPTLQVLEFKQNFESSLLIVFLKDLWCLHIYI